MEKIEKISITILFLLLPVSVFFDYDLTIFINSLRNNFVDFVFLNIIIYSFYLLPLLPLIFIRENPEIAVNSFLSAFFSYISGSIIKMVIARPRPYEILEINLLNRWVENTFSFPSTTTALAFGFSLPLLLYMRGKIKYVSFLLSTLVGFFVIYTGYHYFSDVVGGILLAFFWTTLIRYVSQAFHLQKHLTYLLDKLQRHRETRQ